MQGIVGCMEDAHWQAPLSVDPFHITLQYVLLRLLFWRHRLGACVPFACYIYTHTVEGVESVGTPVSVASPPSTSNRSHLVQYFVSAYFAYACTSVPSVHLSHNGGFFVLPLKM